MAHPYPKSAGLPLSPWAQLRVIVRAFAEGLINKDEKVTSSKKHAQFTTRVQKTYPMRAKMDKIDTLLLTKGL